MRLRCVSPRKRTRRSAFVNPCYPCSINLTDANSQHRYRSTVDTFHRKRDVFVFMLRAEHVKQWQVVIRSRDREKSIASESLVVDQWIKFAVEHQLTRAGFKTHGPIVR